VLIIEPENVSDNIQYFINTNKTILYIYNKEKNQIKRFFTDKWSSMNIPVKVIDDDVESVAYLDFKTIIQKDALFIKKVSAIASTVKSPAFFEDLDDDTGITSNFLNEFLGSKDFIEAKNNNHFTNKKSLTNLLKNETPTFNLLLNNLFYGENDEVIENFLRWLRVCSFEDKHQDILFLFCGTSELNQGQGAGKGVLIELLNNLLSGLVVSVSNADYETNFNSNLMNKKIVVFDEVNFKTLKYESIKNTTGSSLLRIEFKGKEPINADNVSSWLMFTNEHDLHDRITFDDRRTFLVRPNPKNGSLLEIIKKKFGTFDKFRKALYAEKENIVHIIAKSTGKVLSPLELTTEAKREYFKDKSTIEMVDLKDLYQFLSNKEMFKKLLAVLTTNDLFTDKDKIKFIKSHSINYKLFFEIYQVLLKNGLTKKESPLFAWERLKEFSLKNGFELVSANMPETKKYKRYTDKTLVLKSGKNKKELREVKQKLREFYGKTKTDTDVYF
jgi:hypothetical protein